MINQELYKIQIPEVEAMKKAAYFSKEAAFDGVKGELTFKVNHASGKSFRLVHDDVKVVAVIEGMDKTITSTMHTIEEFDTEKAVADRIEALNLTLLEDKRVNLETMVDPHVAQ